MLVLLCPLRAQGTSACTQMQRMQILGALLCPEVPYILGMYGIPMASLVWSPLLECADKG